MPLKNRGRMHWGNSSTQTVRHSLSLTPVRYATEDGFGLHDLSNGHGDRPVRNLSERLEPALPHLLPPAGMIKLHHNIRSLCFKISWWVVKGQMPILTNAGKTNVNRMPRKNCAHPTTLRRKIPLAVNIVKRR